MVPPAETKLFSRETLALWSSLQSSLPGSVGLVQPLLTKLNVTPKITDSQVDIDPSSEWAILSTPSDTAQPVDIVVKAKEEHFGSQEITPTKNKIEAVALVPQQQLVRPDSLTTLYRKNRQTLEVIKPAAEKSSPNISTQTKKRRTSMISISTILILISFVFFIKFSSRYIIDNKPLESPDEVVRIYYQALSKHDSKEILKRRKNPPSSTAIDRIEWFKINNLKLTKIDTDKAIVEIDVTGKNAHEKPQTWAGPIILEKIGDEWKIVDMQQLKRQQR